MLECKCSNLMVTLIGWQMKEKDMLTKRRYIVGRHEIVDDSKEVVI